MRHLIVLVLAAFASGCIDGADVMSPDGNQIIGLCNVNWVSCVQTMCPNGYTIVKKPEVLSTNGLIRCKP